MLYTINNPCLDKCKIRMVIHKPDERPSRIKRQRI